MDTSLQTQQSAEPNASAGEAPVVSVIIPVYNCREYIREALDSILSQDFGNIEILIVDDGSDDFAYSTLADLDPRIRVFRRDKGGVSRARNFAMSQARGEFFAFLDADDVWFPGKLSAQAAYLEAHPEVGVVFGGFIRWERGEDGEYPAAAGLVRNCSTLARPEPTRSGWIYTRLLLGLLVGMNTAMIRRTVYERIGGFDESLRIGEDYDFWLRASRVAEMDCLDAPIALYRMHPASAMHRLDAENHLAFILQRAHAQWGTVDPNGNTIPDAEFRRRVAMTYFAHGYSHYWDGNASVALDAFRKALEGGARPSRALVYLGLAAARVMRERARSLRSDSDERSMAARPATLEPQVTAPIISRRAGAPLWARLAAGVVSGDVVRRRTEKLTIFNFHKVPGESDEYGPDEFTLRDFEQLLAVVQRYFVLLPLEDAIARLGRNALPPFAAALTFDDGYSNWLTGVVPYLETHRLPATFFITTCQLQGRPLWFERLHRVLNALGGEPRRLQPLLRKYGVRSHPLAPVQAADVIKHAKYLGAEHRDAFILECEELSGVARDYPLFSADDVRALHDKGFSIGAHTVNHPILSRCSNDEARAEIAESKEMLESVIRAPVNLFAYPNGLPGVDIVSTHVRYVRQAGFAAAVTTALGAATRQTSLYQLPRFSPWAKTSNRLLVQYLMTLGIRFPVVAEERIS
ncbi:MAG TPA: glycosyltransferase [Burkholderiales bacterium]|nr:glycosyltransferase [Burkholderiales bacterium]